MDTKDALMLGSIGAAPTAAIRLACLTLAVDTYPRTARRPGGELELAAEFVAWVSGGNGQSVPAPAAAASRSIVQEGAGQGGGDDGDGADGDGGEILTVTTTKESPAGQPASLKQAGAKGK